MGKNMTEKLDHSNQSDTITLWKNVQDVWPTGLRVINPRQKFDPTTHALFTFCPLYTADKSLAETTLMTSNASIENSRVANKWKALQVVLNVMAENLHASSRDLDITVIFANKGVLLNGEPSLVDEDALSEHEMLYKQAVSEFCTVQNVGYSFYNYDQLGVNFPRFVNPNSSIVDYEEDTKMETEREIIFQINKLLQNLSVTNQIKDNKDSRRVLKDLINSFGFANTFWIVAGYLPFDFMIPNIVGPDGIYLSVERFGALHRIAKLTQELKGLTRIEIDA